MKAQKKTSVLIVDDHSVVRAGLSALLGREDDLVVCGEAANGLEALEQIRRSPPDVVVLDFMMPRMDGAETTAVIHTEFPDVKILILTTYGTSDGIAHALESGANGAIQKSIDSRDLIETVRAVAAGKRVVSPDIEQSLNESPPIPRLTERQIEVLQSITRGLTNHEIATQLGISTEMVKDHLNVVFNKLGASGRSEAVAIALRKHLLKI